GGVLLIFLSFAAFYLSFAARHYTEDRVSQGIENLVLLIEGDDQVLQRFYDLESQRRKLMKKKEAAGENFYLKALEDKVARAAALSGADAAKLRDLVNEAQSPGEIAGMLREKKKQLDAQPATVAGVSVPSGSLGFRVPAAFISNAMIIALAPLIIAWLGALYATRRRELVAAYDGHELFPHVLNADPLPLETLVRRYTVRWDEERLQDVRHAIFRFARMAILAMLIVPVIGTYIATVATLGMVTEGAWMRYIYAVVVVVIMLVQSAALLLGEKYLPPGDEATE
ncbi:MAG TPA: hypothetical protein VIQ62_02960, partial [Burkholderiales bacterium]